MEYIYTMSDCIVKLRLSLIAHILLFVVTHFFLLFIFLMLTMEIFVMVFSGTIEARVLELGIYVYI